MAEYQIKNVREKHRELLRLIVADPAQSNKELAQQIRVSPTWVSIVRNSDVFKAMMEAVQEDLDYDLTQGIKQQLNGVASQTLERMLELIPQSNDIDELNDVMDSALDRLGYNAKKAAPQMNFYDNSQTANVYGSVPASVLAEVREKMGKKYDYEVPALSENAPAGESNGSEETVETATLVESDEKPQSSETPRPDLREQNSRTAFPNPWEVSGPSSVD